MKTFIKYFLTLLGGFALGIISIALVLGFFISSISGSLDKDSSQELGESTMLKLVLSGDVAERVASSPIDEIFSATTNTEISIGLNEITNGFKLAGRDTKIKGVYLDCGNYLGGMAVAEEIRNAIIDFQKTGKMVIAYSGIYSELGYYIASACNKVILNPRGMLEFDGISAKFVMYKGLFDKLGIDFQVFRAGKFKSAVEPFIQNTLSEENRLQVNQYISSLYTYQIGNIAKSRNLNPDSVWWIAMNATAQMPKDGLRLKLIDNLEYESEAKALAVKTCAIKKGSENWYPFSKYAKDADPYEYSENKIAVIYAVGEILPGKQNPFEQIGSTSFITTLDQAKNDPSIKAIVIRINSPGGSAYASDEIAHEIIACKKIKPVIVSFGNVSASGGYYMGCVADSIFALPNTITGSIGVFALIANTGDLFGKKMGMNYETVELGKFSAGWRPDRKLGSEEQAFLQKSIVMIYDDFIGTVASGRKMSKDRVAELAEGRVYAANDALALHLIDGYGGIDRAIVSAARKSKITDYRVVELPKSLDFISQILNSDALENTKLASLAKTSGMSLQTMKELDQLFYLQGPQYLLPWSANMH